MRYDNVPAAGPFDFDVPEWMCPHIRCPMPPNTQSPPPSIAEKKQFLVERAFRWEDWLAGMGYERGIRPGYLGLSFDAKAGTVRREGCSVFARLGKKSAHLISALLHAGPSGLEDHMLHNVYPGTNAARRKAIDELRKKLEPLGVTIADRHWKLIDTHKGTEKVDGEFGPSGIIVG